MEEQEAEGGSSVKNRFGSWPATRNDEAVPDGPLTAILDGQAGARVRWCGSREPSTPEVVTASFREAIGYRDAEEPRALRRPQLGALHSIMGYWSTGSTEPAVVVMPTGTGKTETMLAVMLAERPERLLVLVPTTTLRDQVAGKFETLGVLQRAGIAESTALRPCVARLEHGIKTQADAVELLRLSNVVVATPHVLQACEEDARGLLLAGFSHLVVDEAHHAMAPTWKQVVDEFSDRKVLLFTATPFREDGRGLPGRTIYRFPLREAQKDGYFTEIDYRAVACVEDVDTRLADLAITRLREDLAAGHEHVLMARAKSIPRAEELLALYEARASDLGPVVLHQNVKAADRAAAHRALERGECRVVVCVDMLGEGYDLPALKVAALHDVRKSLSPMIQLIGRFTRTGSPEAGLGTASVFVARDPSVTESPLRELLREDADWNLLLRDVTERVSAAGEAASEFDASFREGPDDVTTASLEPKMSAVAHRAPSAEWSPESALAFYGADKVLDSSIALSSDSSVAWFVLEHRTGVPWGEVQSLVQVFHELIVLYFDQAKRLLYIHSSEKQGDYAELADAVLGPGGKPVKGIDTFRVLAHFTRLIPTNVGMLDVRSHFRRFSMHVGSDVLNAIDPVEREGKSQTHISTSGFGGGERITISAAMSGRFWSMRSAPDLKAWRDWCDEQGAKLLDTSIDMDEVMLGFIAPEPLNERPELVLLGAEWDWSFYSGAGSTRSISLAEKSYGLLDVELRVDDFGTTGPFRLSFVTHAWEIAYRADVIDGALVYAPLGVDGRVIGPRSASSSLTEWVNRNKPTLFLEGDRMIDAGDRLLTPRRDLPPFDREKLKALSWSGVDFKVESQGPERRPDSIQNHMAQLLLEQSGFDLLIDDDGAGEAADLVGLRVVGQELHITLVHCKYSSKTKAGARVKDLYELCGQAVRGAKWRQQGACPLLHHLVERGKRFYNRTGQTPYMRGDISEHYDLMLKAPELIPHFHTVLAQPGLSAEKVGGEQLRLLAGAESYVRAVTHGSFLVYCSQ
ncbi:DEAD/DEAH box helicase family protein [Actinosynnema pretiosum subsp. pretiosum]|uniref:DEAD/DEAH box helicase family protein n=1 Tax=Actinosynnema pretiosum subsp. pretiosum TaxID=103721 RepID=A0AA45L6U4_9PSEU|nr:Helicase, C-terminal:DEAD/DEAH box helicase, N-terminal [Actinosynnema pretiosum subsp. pretiosum]QUF04250.1 DEAD/DEAH box helicase family protein [Actinosynnema pretiosum subsp. pretiosum]